MRHAKVLSMKWRVLTYRCVVACLVVIALHGLAYGWMWARINGGLQLEFYYFLPVLVSPLVFCRGLGRYRWYQKLIPWRLLLLLMLPSLIGLAALTANGSAAIRFSSVLFQVCILMSGVAAADYLGRFVPESPAGSNSNGHQDNSNQP